jgi:hypothetical protein
MELTTIFEAVTDLDLNYHNNEGEWRVEVEDHDGHLWSGDVHPAEFIKWASKKNTVSDVPPIIMFAESGQDWALIVQAHANSEQLETAQVYDLDKVKYDQWDRILGIDILDALYKYLSCVGYDTFNPIEQDDDDDNNETYADFLRKAHAAYDDSRKM